MNDGAATSAQQDDTPITDPPDDLPSPPPPRPPVAEQDSASVDVDASRARRARLRHLLTQLDSIVYVLLCSMYYMDCLTIPLLVRTIIQFTYLTPKPAELPVPKPSSYCSPIIISNILCILLHIFLHAPVGGESTRGYLHGSLFIDFIGTKGPSSKIRLILYDVTILALQLVCFVTTIIERQESEKSKKSQSRPRRRRRRAWVEQLLRSTGSSQNESRESNQAADGDIEMDTLSPTGETSSDAAANVTNDTANADEGADQGEQSTLLSSQPAEEDSSTATLEQFAAGQVVIADFHIWDAIQNDLYEARNRVRSRERI